MTSTSLANRDCRPALPVRGLLHGSTLLALALLLSCAKGAARPEAPTGVLHYPAWMGVVESPANPQVRQLLVVNLDQDLFYDSGALVALDPTGGQVVGGIAVPNMAGQLFVVDTTAARQGTGEATDCTSAFEPGGAYTVPFAFVAGRFENTLTVAQLTPDGAVPFGRVRQIELHPFSASFPFGVGFSCSPGSPSAVPRAWVGYQSGMAGIGYVDQIDLRRPPGSPGSIVQVNLGKGPPRSFAYDPAHDRLYFTTRELGQSAPLRWIDIGSGCLAFPGGIQDERQGGCHVDGGFDLSLQFRGAEPNVIRLDPVERPCTVAGFAGQTCRRAYLSVRMYDADLAAFLGARPSGDIGGKLVVLDLPEGGLGRPVPQVVAEFDIGVIAGDVEVISRGTDPGSRRPLVAVTAVDDELLWVYDDDLGAMVAVFGRGQNGVPLLGSFPSAIAGIPSQDGTTARLFVTSYQDHWVSAVDVPLDDPGSAALVMITDPNDPTRRIPWRLGVSP